MSNKRVRLWVHSDFDAMVQKIRKDIRDRNGISISGVGTTKLIAEKMGTFINIKDIEIIRKRKKPNKLLLDFGDFKI